jgi:K+-transporting ATPase KdpF subunit
VRNAAIGWVTPSRNATEVVMVSVYVLALLVVFLVIYLFYAIINPEKI